MAQFIPILNAFSFLLLSAKQIEFSEKNTQTNKQTLPDPTCNRQVKQPCELSVALVCFNSL